MSENLTKKQQKALAFRAKQKAKKSGRADGEQEDVPEQDLEEDDVVDAVVVAEGSRKKRKRDTAKLSADGDVQKGKVKQKSRSKTAWDEEEEGEDGDDEKKSKKEVKQRFILFVGNLDFKTTREDIQTHFQPAIGHAPAVRLLTNKPNTPSSSAKPKSKAAPGKSRGIAFLELPTSLELQACLKLHHSTLQGRKINVELTAGGGGKGEGRKEKIKERNERVGGQRERRAEKEKEEGGEGEREGGVEVVRDQGEERKGAAADGSKLRGGRRVKAKPNHSAGPLRQPDGARKGYTTRPSYQPGGRPQQSRRQWEPTGANAVVVG